MDATLTEYLIESVHSTFENAFTTSVNEIHNPPEEALLYSKIGITDNTQTKEIIIGMPKEGLVFLSGIYFGCEDDFSNEELEDFIKELSNLILGRVKARYLSNNKEAKLEIPKIVLSENIDNSIVKYFKIKDTYLRLTY